MPCSKHSRTWMRATCGPSVPHPWRQCATCPWPHGRTMQALAAAPRRRPVRAAGGWPGRWALCQKAACWRVPWTELMPAWRLPRTSIVSFAIFFRVLCVGYCAGFRSAAGVALRLTHPTSTTTLSSRSGLGTWERGRQVALDTATFCQFPPPCPSPLQPYCHAHVSRTAVVPRLCCLHDLPGDAAGTGTWQSMFGHAA